MRDYSIVTIAGLAALSVMALAVPARADLIGYWSFDDSTATDLSAFNNDGTVGSGMSFTSQTPLGTGLALKGNGAGGTAGIVLVPNSSSLQSVSHAMTLSFWIQALASDNATWFRVFRKGAESDTTQGWSVSRNGSGDRLLLRVDTLGVGGTNNQNRGGGLTVLDGNWHHIVYTLDNGNFAEYIDGARRTSATYNHGDGFSNTRNFEIAGRQSGNLKGALDDVALWNESVDPARAMSIYNVPTTLGLAYDLGDMLTLWSIHDVGEGGFGMIGNMPWWYTDELPGTPADPGGAYVHDNLMYVVLGDGTGLRTPEPSTFVLLLLGLCGLLLRRNRALGAIVCGAILAWGPLSATARADLIGYWSFDDSTATDLSGIGNHGTVGSNVTFTADTPFGTGLAGQTAAGGGSTRVVTIPDSPTLRTVVDQFAISFWIKGTEEDNNDWVRIFQKGTEGGGDRSWLINRNSGTADVNMRVDTAPTAGGAFNQNIATGGTVILDGVWHHMLYSLNNGSYVEYVDGSVSRSGSYTHGDGFYNERPLYMFGRSNTGQFLGLLDDVALWNQSLDPARAMSIYNVPTTLGLAYDLGDMLTLWSIHDVGEGGFGMIGNMPWWYTDELPGTPADPGGAYVHDNLMYVVLGDGTGLRTPEPSTFVLTLLALVFLSCRRRRR